MNDEVDSYSAKVILEELTAKIYRTPRFINQEGYSLAKNPEASEKADKSIYDFRLCIPCPLTFFDGAWYWQPNRRFQTDLGSIPGLMQCCPAFRRDRFLMSYIFHDSGYSFGGLHRCTRLDGLYQFDKLTRDQVDTLLYQMLGVEGAWDITRWLIWAGVRCGGGWAWGKGDRAKKPSM